MHAEEKRLSALTYIDDIIDLSRDVEDLIVTKSVDQALLLNARIQANAQYIARLLIEARMPDAAA